MSIQKLLKRFWPLILIILGVVFVLAKISEAVSNFGGLLVIVGVVIIIVRNRKKPKSQTLYKGAYVVNPDSKIFHHPDCQSLAKIDPVKNIVLNVSREKVIKEGYKPCKICRP
jgi:DNA-entry nuclease